MGRVKKNLMKIILTLCFIVFFSFSKRVCAVTTYEVPVYDIGDYWDYKYTNKVVGEFLYEFDIRYEVVSRRLVTDYWGVTFECYEVHGTSDQIIDLEGEPWEIQIDHTEFLVTSNLKVMKLERSFFMYHEPTNQSELQETTSHTYSNASIFPMQLGDEQWIHTDSVISIVIYQNGILLLSVEEEPGSSIGYLKVDDNLHTVSVTAGTFECVKNEFTDGDSFLTQTVTNFYSSEVERNVKQIHLIEATDFSQIITEELIDYTDNKNNINPFAIPGYPLFVTIGICLGILIFVIVRDRLWIKIQE